MKEKEKEKKVNISIRVTIKVCVNQGPARALIPTDVSPPVDRCEYGASLGLF